MSDLTHPSSQNMHAENQFAKVATLMWVLAVIVFILSLVVIIIKVFSSSEVSALRYNIIVGVTEIGSRYQLFQLPLAGFLIGVVNFALVKLNKSSQQILPLLAALVTLSLNIILLLAAVLLFQVN
ncbi:hypothetical protein IPM19_03245 [bacterium]|nr:MAG: hypothetical protein IPM19_03245 [bacterium]